MTSHPVCSLRADMGGGEHESHIHDDILTLWVKMKMKELLENKRLASPLIRIYCKARWNIKT